MDLENFPTSQSAKEMLRMVSTGFYDESYVGKWIYQVMGAELDAASEKASTLAYQAFLDEATWGLCYWELLVGLPVREDLSYEERRALIRERLDNRHPVSPGWLSQYLTNITGRECTVTENKKTYTFSVQVGAGEDSFSFDFMLKRLDAVKPAHLSYAVIIELKAEMSVFVGMSAVESRTVEPTEEALYEAFGYYPYMILDSGQLDSTVLG